MKRTERRKKRQVTRNPPFFCCYYFLLLQVLKTSGTTVHLPSPSLKSTTCDSTSSSSLSVLPSCNNPKAFATSSLCRSRYLLCICTEVCPEAAWLCRHCHVGAPNRSRPCSYNRESDTS